MIKTNFLRQAAKRALVYLRMSTESQNPRSPDQQFDNITTIIKREQLPWTIVGEYRDEAVSGRLMGKRKGLQRMLLDIRSRRIQVDVVLVDNLERLTRVDGYDLRAELKRYGVLVLTADSNFADPTSIAGKALAFVEQLRATEDGYTKAHYVLRGKRDAARLGHWPGGKPPFGLKLENVYILRNGLEELSHHRVVPDPRTSWIVQEMFKLADEKGFGGTRIASELRANPNIPDIYKPFNPSTLAEQLENQLYIGVLVWSRNCTGIVDDTIILQQNPEEEWTVVPDFCEPIIDRAVWDRVQQLRQARSARHEMKKNSKRTADQQTPAAPGMVLKYPLSGLVRCAHCRRSMVATSSGPYTDKAGTQRRYVNYACPGRVGEICTNTCAVSEDWLRGIVADLLRKSVLDATPQRENV